MSQDMIQNGNLFESFLLMLYLFMKTIIFVLYYIFLSSCAYKVADKWMIDYLSDNLFETNENYLLVNGFYKCCFKLEWCKRSNWTC